MNFIEVAQADLLKSLNKDEFFVFNKEHLKALAFLHGVKSDCVEKIKYLGRKHGYEYNYDYDCYMKADKSECKNGQYRREKDEFIDKIIKWKLSNNKV